MGFKVKIEGAETIDLSIESVQTVKTYYRYSRRFKCKIKRRRKYNGY